MGASSTDEDEKPPHLGRIVRHDCLESLCLTVTKGAKILGVTRQALNNPVKCKAASSPPQTLALIVIRSRCMLTLYKNGL